MTRPVLSPIDRLIVSLVYAQRRAVIGKLASFVLQVWGVYFPRVVEVGPDLSLPHASAGLVIYYKTRIGARVTIFHNVTIGRADVHDLQENAVPGAVIEDDVILAAGAVILPGRRGELVIGRGAIIGANAVVTTSVPAGEIWAGNPARKVGERSQAG